MHDRTQEGKPVELARKVLSMCRLYRGGLIMKVEYLVWTGKEKFKVMYDEGKALKYAARVKAGEVEKCTITPGGLIVDSEVIWKYTGPRT